MSELCLSWGLYKVIDKTAVAAGADWPQQGHSPGRHPMLEEVRLPRSSALATLFMPSPCLNNSVMTLVLGSG